MVEIIILVVLLLLIVAIAAVAAATVVAHRRRRALTDERFDAIDRMLAENARAIAAFADQQTEGLTRQQRTISSELDAVRVAMLKRLDDRTAPLRVGKQSIDQRARRGVARDAHALLSLHARYPLDAESLDLSSFSADPSTILHLTTLVSDLSDGALVVELGSGLSTVWMAAAAAREGRGIRIISFDHDEHWAQETRDALARLGLHCGTEVRLAPLEPLPDAAPGDVPWYAVTAMTDLPTIDLLVVDGPPAATGPSARRPAVPVLGERLAERAMIVLDDTDRDEEQEILQQWLADLGRSRAVRVVRTLDRTTVVALEPLPSAS